MPIRLSHISRRGVSAVKNAVTAAAAVIAVLIGGGCDPVPKHVAVVADSMGFYDPAVIESEIEASGHTVVRYHTVPGATTWTHPDLTPELFAPDIDAIVVTFALNETRHARGDFGTPMPMSAILGSWNTVKTQAAQQGKCLVWVNTPTAWPLNSADTAPIIAQLNSWTAANTRVAQWRDPVNSNIWYGGGTWVKDDGFHLQAGSAGPHNYGRVIREALNGCG